MLGSANIIVQSGNSGGGGATVTAVNKTGSAIASGDKVWLNTYNRVSDPDPKLENYDVDNFYGDKNYVPDISGNIYYVDTNRQGNTSFYALNPDGETYGNAQSLPYNSNLSLSHILFRESDGQLIWFTSDTTFGAAPRVLTETALIKSSNSSTCYLNELYGYTYSYPKMKSFGKWISQDNFELDPYTIIPDGISADNIYQPISEVWKDLSSTNTYYYLYSSNTSCDIYKLIINDDDKTVTISKTSQDSTLYNITWAWVTSDNNYLILGYNKAGNFAISTPVPEYQIALAKIENDGSLSIVDSSTLGEFGSILSGYNVVYNRFCNILIATKYGENPEVLMFNYNTESKAFEKQILNINLPENITTQSVNGISGYVGSDGKTLIVRYGVYQDTNWLTSTTVYRLTTSGESTEAFLFKSSLVNNDTITGYAAEDAGVDASFTANVASKSGGGGDDEPDYPYVEQTCRPLGSSQPREVL